ncbi:MAG: hypothetical protein ACOC8F_07840 [Planctomycetota bacterium]
MRIANAGMVVLAAVAVGCGVLPAGGADGAEPLARASGLVTLHVDRAMDAPRWARMQRRLIRRNTRALGVFYRKYYDDRGYLKVKPELGGGSGADDAMEHTYNWPLLYALGGDDEVLRRTRQAWEGHFKQYTEAGGLSREFIKSFDWQHNGEHYCSFFHLGLCIPEDPSYIERVTRFADFYLGMPNYDPELKIIRSVLNGSEGPNMSPTKADWSGSDFFEHWTGKNARGDTPFNLQATSLVATAYMVSGEEKYRAWVKEYCDAWVRRARDNGWNFPGNISPNGIVGEDWPDPAEQFPGYVPEGAKIYPWAGGIMGWAGWGGWCFVPSSVRMGMKNAYLLTGDARYLRATAKQLSNLREGVEIGRRADGRPVMRGVNFQVYWMAMDLYLMTMDSRYAWFMDGWEPGRWQAGEGMYGMGYTRDWIAWLRGQYPEFPTRMLQSDLDRIEHRLERIGTDDSEDWKRPASMLRKLTPVSTSALTMLTTGGREPSWRGSRLICRLRYFDADNGRPGLPPDVAALVDEMNGRSTHVMLVNLSAEEPRTVVVQGGAHAEHTIVAVRPQERGAAKVGEPAFAVTLEPGCGTRLRIEMERFANRPTLALPWSDPAGDGSGR